MSQAWFDPNLFPFFSLAGMGSLLALTGFVQFFRGKNFSPLAHVVFGSLSFACVIFSVAALAQLQPVGIWAAPLVFAAVYFSFFVVPTPAFAEGTRRLAALYRRSAARLGGLMLVLVLCPVIAMTLALNAAAPYVVIDRNNWEDMVSSRDSGEFDAVQPSPVSTDRGGGIKVYKKVKQSQPIDPRVLQDQVNLLDAMKLNGLVIQVAHGWQPCNCHGWVFTAGHYWLKPDDVELILKDNGYHQVKTPQANDIAVYRDNSGVISHTGLVRSAAAGTILVESKWGRLGRIIHPHDVHCYYQTECTFYRADRVNHLLQGLPSQTAPSLPGPGILDPLYTTSSRPVRLQ